MLLHAPAGEFESNRSMRALIDAICVLWLMNVKELHMESKLFQLARGMQITRQVYVGREWRTSYMSAMRRCQSGGLHQDLIDNGLRLATAEYRGKEDGGTIMISVA